MNRKRQKVFAVLPTLLTLGNAACGFGAITIAAKVGPENLGGRELLYAGGLIFLAMLFDALDGSAARLTNQTSEFGAQLDSLCDAISFGAAPAFLMLQLARPEHNIIALYERHPLLAERIYHPRVLWVIAVLYCLCAILRLARFNVETDEEDTHEGFSGLPSPAAAGVIASFPIALHGLGDLATNDVSPASRVMELLVPFVIAGLPLFTLSVACLMVSRISYPHFVNQIFRGQRSRRQLLQIVFTIALVYMAKEMAMPVILCYFAFAAPLKAGWSEFVGGRLHKSAET